MRAMACEDIRPGVDALMRKVDDEFWLFFDLHPAAALEPAPADHILVVETDNDKVRLAPRFADLAQVFFDVPSVGFRANVELITQYVVLAMNFVFRITGGADLRRGIETMVNNALALGVESKRRANALERGERFSIDDKRHFMAERIHTRLSRKINPLVDRAVIRRMDMSGGGDEGDSASRGVPVDRAAGRAQICSGAGVENSRGIKISVLQQQPLLAEIKGMAIRTADHIEAQPLDVIEQFRFGHHVGPCANARMPLAITNHEAFEIGKRGISRGQDLAELQVIGLAVNRQFPRWHDIAAERDRDGAAVRFVRHWILLNNRGDRPVHQCLPSRQRWAQEYCRFLRAEKQLFVSS